MCACAALRLFVYTYHLQGSRQEVNWKLTLEVPLAKWGL